MSLPRLITLLLAFAPGGIAFAANSSNQWFLTTQPDTSIESAIKFGALPARFSLPDDNLTSGLEIGGGYRNQDLLKVTARYFDLRYQPSQLAYFCMQTFACQGNDYRQFESTSVSGVSAGFSQGLLSVPGISVYGNFGLMRMNWRFPALHDLPTAARNSTYLFSDVGIRYRFHHGPSIEIGSEQLQVDMSVTRISLSWEP